jgi:cell wall-associated NlpC family hydrolase
MNVIVPPPPKSAREKFLEAVLAQTGRTVLMGHLDCSELVAIGVIGAGGPDQTKTHTAQRYCDETRRLELSEFPQPGDLGFYGTDRKSVIHVVIYVAPGRILSADGATRRITTIEEAALAGAKVKEHTSEHYRRDVPFLGFNRNTVIDSLEFVTR